MDFQFYFQGGPGSSSLFGMFSEMGPFRVADDGMTLIPTPSSWNQRYSMLL
jgi:carboxypeptidase C (cathepsin A)